MNCKKNVSTEPLLNCLLLGEHWKISFNENYLHVSQKMMNLYSGLPDKTKVIFLVPTGVVLSTNL